MIPLPKPEDPKGKPTEGESPEIVSGLRMLVWSDLPPALADKKGLGLDCHNGPGGRSQG
jgi:hypothetical protein